MPPALMASKDEGLGELKKKEPWRITKEDFDKLKARIRRGHDVGIEEIRSYFWTPPYDPRFPNTNQTRNCYQNYLDYHRCLKAKGEKYEPCYYFKRVYEELCPSEWHEHWDEQRANGTFAGNI